MMVTERRTTWYTSSKETAKRDEDVLARSEDIKGHVEEALQRKE